MTTTICTRCARPRTPPSSTAAASAGSTRPAAARWKAISAACCWCRSAQLFVARLDGVIVGAAQLVRPPRNNEAQAFAATLMHAFIAPYARGHGLARLLTPRGGGGGARARLPGAEPRRAGDPGRRRSRLYESLGYRPLGRASGLCAGATGGRCAAFITTSCCSPRRCATAGRGRHEPHPVPRHRPQGRQMRAPAPRRDGRTPPSMPTIPRRRPGRGRRRGSPGCTWSI